MHDPDHPPPAAERGLGVVKSVSPTGPAAVGDTLTYSLTVTTTGNAAQTGVTVSDFLPGYRPGTTSGKTTYVTGSASCSGAGTCTTAYDPTTHQVTFGLGTMAAGTNRSVSFQVTIDKPTPAADGSIAAFDVVNIGVVGSDQVPATPSNEVVTPVSAVQGVKVGQGPNNNATGTPTGVSDTTTGVLPHTGNSLPVGWLIGLAGLLLLSGAGLVSMTAVRRRG